MRLAASVLCILGTFLIACSISPVSLKQIPHKETSIVRLHDVATGAFFCSGVVIADDLILTAAHCVVHDTFFGAMLTKKVEIRAEDGEPMGLYATTSGANPRQDVALLTGSFKLFDKRQVEIRPEAIEASFLHSHNLAACGYPEGGKLVCTSVTNVAHMNFGFSAQGFLYPGMSGGPVIDQETGKVIAVNTAVADDRIFLSPTVELFKQLGL